MAVVGGVGIPFEAFTGNYVDCWQFRVDPGNLFVGQWLAGNLKPSFSSRISESFV